MFVSHARQIALREVSLLRMVYTLLLANATTDGMENSIGTHPVGPGDLARLSAVH